jgi:hypothetical protein
MSVLGVPAQPVDATQVFNTAGGWGRKRLTWLDSDEFDQIADRSTPLGLREMHATCGLALMPTD